MLTLAEWILRLTRGYIKFTGKKPDGLAKLKIKMEAAQKVKDQKKVVKGDFSPGERWWEARSGKGSKVDLSKYTDEDLNALVREDIDLITEANKLSEAGTNYGRVVEIKARRKEIREILEAAQAVPESGYGNIKADLALEKQKKPIKPDPEDMASGGIARVGMFVGGPVLAKGAKWFLKSLNDTKEQIKLLDITLSQKKQYLDQIEDQIRRINAGEPIPDEVIQTIRKDPKFKSVWQNQKSSDPDLREMEEVLLEYGEKHASGGIAGQLHLNRPGYAEQGFVEGDYPIEVGPLKVKPRASIIESEEGVGPDVEKKTGFSNIGADMTLDIGKGFYGKGIYDKGRASEDIYYQGEKVMEDVPLDHDIWKYGIGYGDEGMRAEVIYNPKAERYDFRLVKSFTKGGLAHVLGV